MSVVRATLRAALATVCVAGCTATPVFEESGSSHARVTTTQGDWSQLGGGQCLVAMQDFYSVHFGVRVPAARNSYTGSCGEEGACHIWYDDIPDPALWTRVPNDGSASPATYDLVVYAETSSNPYGHIASVDHVEDGAIYVMDSNYGGDEQRSAAPHTVSRAPLGWYHLKALADAPTSTRETETCGDRATRLGWAGAYCEQAGSSDASSRVACNGTGSASSDCTRCCDAEAIGPAQTDESCGVYAERVGFASPRCESSSNGACNGSGPSTGDGCLHCCDTP